MSTYTIYWWTFSILLLKFLLAFPGFWDITATEPKEAQVCIQSWKSFNIGWIVLYCLSGYRGISSHPECSSRLGCVWHAVRLYMAIKRILCMWYIDTVHSLTSACSMILVRWINNEYFSEICIHVFVSNLWEENIINSILYLIQQSKLPNTIYGYLHVVIINIRNQTIWKS